ncbi:MAG TPA: phage tail protein [Verrucomicrobiae bacterium]|jgi:phage tail-like protein
MSLVNPVPVFDFTVFLMDATPSAGALGALGGAVAGMAGAMLTGTFAEVSGLNAEMETEEYREGGLNTGPHKFIKWGKPTNLVFKKGVTPDTGLWDWFYQVLYGDQSVLRKNGIIILSDRGPGAGGAVTGIPGLSGLAGLGRIPTAVWSFSNGLPEKVTGPALNGKSNEIAIETLEIAHEGLTRVGAAMLPGMGDIAGSISASAGF